MSEKYVTRRKFQPVIPEYRSGASLPFLSKIKCVTNIFISHVNINKSLHYIKEFKHAEGLIVHDMP